MWHRPACLNLFTPVPPVYKTSLPSGYRNQPTSGDKAWT